MENWSVECRQKGEEHSGMGICDERMEAAEMDQALVRTQDSGKKKGIAPKVGNVVSEAWQCEQRTSVAWQWMSKAGLA